jgi:beta-glucosidase-like glycosyl hydrolase
MVQISDPAAVPAAVQALTAAAGAGTISGQRLDDAAGRVLELKRKLGLFGGGANGRAAR